MRITAPQPRVLDLVDRTLSEVADFIAFGTVRRVRRYVGSITDGPPGSESGGYKTRLPMTRVPGPNDVVGVSPAFLKHVFGRIGDLDSERGRRITRALRWLRRSLTAGDETAESAALAFAYEALSSLLPTFSVQESRQDIGSTAEAPTQQESSAQQKPDNSKKPRQWAVERAKIKADDWKEVSRLRHS